MRKTTFLIAILAMILSCSGGAMADEPAAGKGKTESKDKGKSGGKAEDKGGDKGKDESKAGKSKAPDKDPDPDYKSDPIVGDHTKGG